ncbi:MAG TPA: efflux RND transporter periplasmic adaptor subunit [Candidatus Paceibacterota bacterium]|nr:efflux RND transporter periplasmic adaptor subunit [Candidatus Paceibacterota bacterium]HQM34994.1 efflux RND transporter periplasmic adaptor subunit [Candidatus Paceibacterota bacterium]
MNKIINFLKNHRIIAVLIILIIVSGGYFLLKPLFFKNTAAQYLTAKVERGNLTSSITVSGQTIAENSVNLSPKASGEVVYVNLANGKQVEAGETILKIDDEDVRSELKDAQIALNNAKEELAKLEGLSTEEGSIESLKIKRQKDLTLAYQNAVDKLPALFTSTTPAIITNLYNILFDNNLSPDDDNVDYYGKTLMLYNPAALQYSDATKKAYDLAKFSYEEAANNYKSKNITYYSDSNEIDEAINLTHQALKNINNAVRAALNLVHLYKDFMIEAKLQYPSLVDEQDLMLTNYFATTTNLFSQIDTIKNNIQIAKENLINVDFDLSDQKRLVEKAERNLKLIQDKLADYTVLAPFSGILGNVATIYVGDNVSPSTTLGVLVSQGYVVEVSLAESDAAQVKIGQKANVSFDVLDDVAATGKVIEIDTVGVVVQGVVSYKAKILLDVIDERVKPGMSTTVEIITDAKENTLFIPRTALKNLNGKYFVRILKDDGTIEQREIKTGLLTDSKVEIIQGLNEGEKIIIADLNSSSGVNLLRTNFSNQRNNQTQIPRGIPGAF